MKEATCEMGDQPKPTSVYITDIYFSRDFFDYQIGIACRFHEDNDRSLYCALSYVTRWGFMFSDYLCSDIAISLIPGRHVPLSTNLNAIVIEPPTKNDSYNHSKVAAKSMPDEKWEQRWGAETPISNSSYKKSEFPALGAVPKKLPDAPSMTSFTSNAKQEGMLSFTEDDHLNEDGDNPWTSRSRRRQPREPDNSAFEIRFNKDQRGKTSELCDMSSVSKIGRGRPLNRENGNRTASGRGRGSGDLL